MGFYVKMLRTFKTLWKNFSTYYFYILFMIVFCAVIYESQVEQFYKLLNYIFSYYFF